MKEIVLTQDEVAQVDDDMFEELNRISWHLVKMKNITYAGHMQYKSGKSVNIHMHWCIVGKPIKGYVVDHIDGIGLNNQRSNLRIITSRQNTQNRHKKYSSKYPGVSWHKLTGKWIAHIKIGEKVYHLGSFDEEEKAFEAYKRMCKISGQEVIIRELKGGEEVGN